MTQPAPNFEYEYEPEQPAADGPSGNAGVRNVSVSLMPSPAKVQIVRVGKTSTPVCGSAGTAAGSLPITRNALPSIRTRLVRRCGLPVQCVVSASVSLSPGDQMLKYGSCATSGTAGGRSGASAATMARLNANGNT